MYAQNYVKLGGFGLAFGESESECAAEGKLYDENTDSCYTNIKPGEPIWGVGTSCGPGWHADPAGGCAPDAAPGGGGGTAPGGGYTPPSSAPTTAKAGMGTGAWLLGGIAVVGLIYLAAKHHKKPHHH
jgi:hypothetical protein